MSDGRLADPAAAHAVDATGRGTKSFTQSYISARMDVAELVPVAARTILDVGCSNGTLARSLMGRRGDRVIDGIDVDPAMAAEAATVMRRVWTADLNAARLITVVGGAADGGPYDAVIFADVLEHLVDPWQVVRDAAALLRPGGSAIISVPNFRHVTALWTHLLGRRFPRRPRGMFDGTHLRWFFVRDVEDLLRQAGMDVSAQRFRWRLRDRPGGRANRWVERLGQRTGLARVRLPSQYLSYQIIVRGERPE